MIARNDLSETEEQLVARYLGGLRLPLQDALSLHSLWSVSEAYQRALVVEKQLSRQGGRTARPQESRPTQQPPLGTFNSNIKCFRCGEQGHKASDYRKPASQKGKNLLLEEEDEPEEMREPAFDDDDDAEEVLYGDG